MAGSQISEKFSLKITPDVSLECETYCTQRKCTNYKTKLHRAHLDCQTNMTRSQKEGDMKELN